MITIEISGDSVTDVEQAIAALHRPDPRTMPLADLLQITKDRFGVAGFVVTATALSPEPMPLPISPTDSVDVPQAEVAPAAEPVDETPKRKRGRPAGSAKKAEPEADAEPEAEADDDTNVVQMVPKPEPEADRAYVLDTLSERFADGKLKLKTKSFIDRVASRHGGTRLSRLPPELFPAIRAEMEAYFGGNGHGHAA